MSIIRRVLTALIGGALTAGTALAQMPVLPKPPFDVSAYFCQEEGRVRFYSDIIALNQFLHRIRLGEEAVPPGGCSTTTIRALERVLDTPEDARHASETVFFGLWVSRSTTTDSPEARYVNDAEMLIYMALYCDARHEERAICIPRLIRETHPLFRAQSPVFCDFAEKEGLSDALVESGMDGDLPGVCARLAYEGRSTLFPPASWEDAWLQQVDLMLFPPVAPHGD